VLHLGLVEQHHDQLLAARLVVDDQRLVFNVGPQASAVDLHRCLKKQFSRDITMRESFQTIFENE
jgi:hypothetical protein